MKRKDGRELVIEHPVTGMDMIDHIPAGELVLPKDAIACRMGERIGFSAQLDEDPSSDDFDTWGA